MIADSAGARSRRPASAVRLLLHQVYYEQLSFWLSPVSAVFTIGFAVIFLVALGLTTGNSHVRFLGNVRQVDYYVPAFAAYGIMSTCFNTLARSQLTARPLARFEGFARCSRRLSTTPSANTGWRRIW